MTSANQGGGAGGKMFALDHTGKVWTTPVPARYSEPAAQPRVESASGINLLVNVYRGYIFGLGVNGGVWKSRTSRLGTGGWCRSYEQC